MTLNYSIYEDGNGGKLYVPSGVIKFSRALYVMIYLRLFQGNIEADTVVDNVAGDLRMDWWGNDTAGNQPDWINSETERVLRGSDTSFESLNDIKLAVENDLSSLSDVANFEVSVTYPSRDRVKILIQVSQKDESSEVVILWDNTKNEIIGNITI